MAELTSFKININKHLDLLVQAGEISEDDREAFHEENVLMWEALFNEAHITSEEPDDAMDILEKERTLRLNARKCLSAVRKSKLTLDKDELELSLRHGEFYWLSDQPRIGWKFDWKDKYLK
ncbi:hypothetical protein C8Z91_06275 [Paenibacillus elgii]|uniref:Uncharacterized protein n=1 Tax=Paenibacillus elgii TaxID=189691 RepID=A0A2T6G7F9_9BACL|nr:hypothetical protein [Paenibacillus elgii]PUA40099.1 hypothetical protein C8Z91_06275 [Paenibacillus elgii]